MLKQTQTKLFDFSDTGLDFSVGSKTLFQNRFKKILADGFNPQTASGAAIVGDQVTLTYGVSHGYKEDRVMQVTAVGGYSKEVYIDAVTTNTVTFTQAVTTGLTGTITTKTAPLGYELVYESGLVQLYKFKDLSENDLFLRLAFPSDMARFNTVLPCIGKTADVLLGTITDTNSISTNKTATGGYLLNAPSWIFDAGWSTTYNNSMYSGGVSQFGKTVIIGSKYHFICLGQNGLSASTSFIYGFLPVAAINETVNYPLLLATAFNYQAAMSNTYYLNGVRTQYYAKPMLGNYEVVFESRGTTPNAPVNPVVAIKSLLPTSIEPFNTTTAEPISIYERTTNQHLGLVAGGLYLAKYAGTDAPSVEKSEIPTQIYDTDLDAKVLLHPVFSGGSATAAGAVFFAAPIEEIKF